MEQQEQRFFAEWDLKQCRATISKKVPASHQKAALANLAKWYSGLSGRENGGILVLPTGGGKTFTAIHFLCNGPLSDGYKVLWLAHTHHLLEQAFHSFTADVVGHIREPRVRLKLRVVSGTPGHYPPRDIRSSDDVLIATLQTITNAHRENLTRFWRALFHRFEQFRSQYDGCQARLLTFTDGNITSPLPMGGDAPSLSEPDEEVKEQVKRRDGNRCLACGTTKYLQVDHVIPIYRGGSNNIDNLQTLCKVCNSKKDTRTIRFTTQQTTLSSAPNALEFFDDPDDATDRSHWERFLRRTLNFTFQCGAVSEISIGGRGDAYYNWTIELIRGNSPAWLKPHLVRLFERVQAARSDAGTSEIMSICVRAPGKGTFPPFLLSRPAGRRRTPACWMPAQGQCLFRAVQDRSCP